MYQERQRYCPTMGELLKHKVNYLKDKYPFIMNFYNTERKINFEDQSSFFIITKTVIFILYSFGEYFNILYLLK